MNELSKGIKKNIITYHNEIFESLLNFIKSIDLENEFNFSYILIYMLVIKWQDEFFSHLRKNSYDYWFFDNFTHKSPSGLLFYGFDANKLDEIVEESKMRFNEMSETWLNSIRIEGRDFFNKNDFNLMKIEFDEKILKGRQSREIAAAYNGVFNTEGWLNFVCELFKKELLGFQVEVKKNKPYIYKIVNDYRFVVEIKEDRILNVNELLKCYGVFNFSIILKIEFLEFKDYTIYPPEISALLSQAVFKRFGIQFKSASYEDAKLRIYTNIKSYCQLINILLPSLIKFLNSNDD